MELLTISRITHLFNISTRTLRYYEQIGLLKSTRKEGYAYRVYDEEAVSRLRRILLLRSLRIPLRQIDALLSDPQASAAAAVLQEHIDSLDREISALDAVRQASAALLARAQQLSPRFTLAQLEDSLEAAPVTSLSKRNHKEALNMQDLNHANAALSRFDNARILYLPPATVASSHFAGPDPEDVAGKQINRFIVQAQLVQCKPDFRLYGFNNPNPAPDSEFHGYEFWVTIPEDMPVPAPLEKKRFEGGLYAAHCIKMGDFEEWGAFWHWVHNHPAYSYEQREPAGMSGSLEEHLNAFTVYQPLTLETAENAEFAQLDLLIPIKLKK